MTTWIWLVRGDGHQWCPLLWDCQVVSLETSLRYRCQRVWWVLWKAFTGDNAVLNAKPWEQFTAVKHKWGSIEVYSDLFGLHSISIPFGVTIKFPYNKRTSFAAIFRLHLELCRGLLYSSSFSLRWYESSRGKKSLQCSTENTNIKREMQKRARDWEKRPPVYQMLSVVGQMCFSQRTWDTSKFLLEL